MEANRVLWDTVTTPSWDDAYAASTPAPWDIGRPQPAFARLADEGRLTGRLLDAGCGTGENALLAASRGADVTGIDVAPTAVARARAKASERGLTARFEVADALDLGRLSLTVDTVIFPGLVLQIPVNDVQGRAVVRDLVENGGELVCGALAVRENG